MDMQLAIRERAVALGADDIVLHRDGVIREAATSCLLFFDEHGPFLTGGAERLESVTLRASIDIGALPEPRVEDISLTDLLGPARLHMPEIPAAASQLGSASTSTSTSYLPDFDVARWPAWVGSSLHGWTPVNSWIDCRQTGTPRRIGPANTQTTPAAAPAADPAAAPVAATATAHMANKYTQAPLSLGHVIVGGKVIHPQQVNEHLWRMATKF